MNRKLDILKNETRNTFNKYNTLRPIYLSKQIGNATEDLMKLPPKCKNGLICHLHGSSNSRVITCGYFILLSTRLNSIGRVHSGDVYIRRRM